MHSGANGATAQISAGSNVELRVTSASLLSETVVAGASGQNGNVILGVPGTQGSGAMHLGHELVGGSLRRFTLSANGGVALFGLGQSVELDAAQVFAQQNVTIEAGSLRTVSLGLRETKRDLNEIPLTPLRLSVLRVGASSQH